MTISIVRMMRMIVMMMMKVMPLALHFALTPLTLAAAAAAEFGSVIYQVGHQR